MHEIIEALKFDIPWWVWPILALAVFVAAIIWAVFWIRQYRDKKRTDSEGANVVAPTRELLRLSLRN